MSDFSDFSDSESDTELSFSSAAAIIERNHTQLSTTDLLELYGLYKQSTCGNCTTPKPSIFQVLARSKWMAWNSVGKLNQNEAKRLYVQKVSRLDPEWLEEYRASKRTGWVVHSTCTCDDEPIEEMNKTAFDYVKENDIPGLRRVFDRERLNELEQESGMGLVHWATDRNACEMLEFLLFSGANVNLQDMDGQTCLHYAASCGHVECLKILINFGADKEMRDKAGNIALEVADDENIKMMLES